MLLGSERLYDLLKNFGINIYSWGKGEAKTVYDLLEEINQGESYLKIDQNGISRVVEIVRIFLIDQNHNERGHLLELSQKLPDGRVRDRKVPPSEKIKSGESPKEAVIRGIKEELQIEPGNYELTPWPVQLENTASPSYPGLSCHYIIHRFEVLLSKSLVLRDNFSITEEDGTIHFFGWENLVAGKS